MLLAGGEKSIWYIYEDASGTAREQSNGSGVSIDADLNSLSMVDVSERLGERYQTSVKAMYVILSLICTASLLVIFLLGYIFKQNKSLVNNSVNVFILNIIFVDLLRCLVQMPVFSLGIHLTFDELSNKPNPINQMKNYEKNHNNNNNYQMLIVGCNLNITLSVLFEIVQLLSFLGISYERYKIVHSPLLNSNKRFFLAKILLTLTWIVAIFLTALVLLCVSIFSGMNFFSIILNQSCNSNFVCAFFLRL